MVRLTSAAQAALRDDEVLVFAWHGVAVCCATAGEVSLQAVPRRVVQHRPARFPALPSEPPGRVHAARAAFPHLLGRAVTVDGARRLGLRRFVSDLPDDFGLRAALGRCPQAR